MQVTLKVFDWDGRWHAYIAETSDTTGRRYSPRRVLWSASWEMGRQLDFPGVLDVLELALLAAGRVDHLEAAEGGPAPLEGPRGGEPSTLTSGDNLRNATPLA